MHDHAYKTPWCYIPGKPKEPTPEEIAALQRKLKEEGQDELAALLEA